MIDKACTRPLKGQVHNCPNIWVLSSSRGYFRVVKKRPKGSGDGGPIRRKHKYIPPNKQKRTKDNEGQRMDCILPIILPGDRRDK